LVLNDIAEVLYDPVKAFKRILENPKYLGSIIVIVLFVALMAAYWAGEFSKVNTENTSPVIGYLPAFTNSTFWNSASGINVGNNYVDYFNYSIYDAEFGSPSSSSSYINLFTNYTSDIGPSSLEINATNTNDAMASLNIASALNSINTLTQTNSTVSYVDCSSPSGFQNISISIEQVSPPTAPQSAILTLYSSDSNFYSYDLTSLLSNETTNSWNNLTIGVGPNSQGWTSSGAPSWNNITSLKLDFSYPTGSNITINIGALFFRGQYVNRLQSFGSTFLIAIGETFPLQILFTWFILAGVMYLFFKGLKANVVWKPIFVGVSFALVVMVVRGVVNSIATLTMPAIYVPYDVAPGITLSILGLLSYPTSAIATLTTTSQAAITTMNSAIAALGIITLLMFVISYIWLGALCTVIIGTLKPEFSMIKRVMISAVSVGVTILLLLLLVGIV